MRHEIHLIGAVLAAIGVEDAELPGLREVDGVGAAIDLPLILAINAPDDNSAAVGGLLDGEQDTVHHALKGQ